MLYNQIIIASLATTVLSHGVITSPPSRIPGNAMVAACGSAVTQLVVSDNTSHIEGMPEAAATTANFNSTACNLFLCKGLQFADNTANVQTFKPGQVVNMLASIPIPHEGPMNVSVINTVTNKAIGAPLISFVSYADESLAVLPANNTNFNVTIPTTLGSACATAGSCVSLGTRMLRTVLTKHRCCNGSGLELALIRLMSLAWIWSFQLRVLTPLRLR
jgi:hypothetical protein